MLPLSTCWEEKVSLSKQNNAPPTSSVESSSMCSTLVSENNFKSFKLFKFLRNALKCWKLLPKCLNCYHSRFLRNTWVFTGAAHLLFWPLHPNCHPQEHRTYLPKKKLTRQKMSQDWNWVVQEIEYSRGGFQCVKKKFHLFLDETGCLAKMFPHMNMTRVSVQF